MRLGPSFITGSALVLAATLCGMSAFVAVNVIEKVSSTAVRQILKSEGFDWADVATDGLQVIVTGTSPSEAMRFRALVLSGGVVDPTRVIDGMDVIDAQPLAAPRFSVELLRNDDGVSMIGLVPQEYDRQRLDSAISNLSDNIQVADLLESAQYDVPDNWSLAMDFALEALAELPRSKISVAAGEVRIMAISSSAGEKARIEADLSRRVPRSVRLALDISAPRPVITPFTLRFRSDPLGGTPARFDACSADNNVGRARILSAARKAGLNGKVVCTLGLGVPSPQWPDAVEQGISAVSDLGGGTVTFSDTEVTLVALPETSQAIFDKVVGALESNLPDGFSLQSVLPEPVTIDGSGATDTGPPEFIATRSPEGQVQLRGRVTDEQVRDAVTTFAKARFGSTSVYVATRIDSSVPEGWPIRVLAGLQALSELTYGSVIVQPDFIQLRGVTGNPNASDTISGFLSDQLGGGQNFEIEARYNKSFDPVLALPSPQECLDKITGILATTKITFDPGSTEITGSAVRVMDTVADVLKACKDVEMQLEIAGYTDSQGREEMNLSLSQQRANSVLDALVARRVLTGRIAATGFGEAEPIADNDSEAGREANRRIEFRLIEDPASEDPPLIPDEAPNPTAETPTATPQPEETPNE
ncbi:MAG: OOP family OmpA-OmpF porin [Paracoccaceae bacterium]|jgi:OOP family OmpA-OmpF porin